MRGEKKRKAVGNLRLNSIIICHIFHICSRRKNKLKWKWMPKPTQCFECGRIRFISGQTGVTNGRFWYYETYIHCFRIHFWTFKIPHKFRTSEQNVWSLTPADFYTWRTIWFEIWRFPEHTLETWRYFWRRFPFEKNSGGWTLCVYEIESIAHHNFGCQLNPVNRCENEKKRDQLKWKIQR